MPRRFSRRRRYNRRARPSFGVKCAQAGGAWLATKAYNMARSAASNIHGIYGMINTELMKYNNSLSTSVTAASGYIIHLSAIAQGDNTNNRHGNSIFLRYINIKGNVRIGSAEPYTRVRVALVIDNQQIGDTSPALTDCYQTASPDSFLNTSTVGRFKVLLSRVFNLSPDKPIASMDINKVVRHHVRFNGTAATDIQKGGVYLLAMSDQYTGTAPSFDANYRLSYYDN